MTQLAQRFQIWFKDAETSGTSLVSAAIVVMGAGAVLEIDFVFYLGVALLGAGLVGWGVNLAAVRELRLFQRGISFSGSVQEFLARAGGVLVVGGGMLLLGYGILTAFFPRSTLFQRVAQFFGTLPGVALLLTAGSLIGILYALAMIFSVLPPSDHPLFEFAKSVPGRLLGILLLVVFIGLGIVGILLAVAPDSLAALLTSLRVGIGVP